LSSAGSSWKSSRRPTGNKSGRYNIGIGIAGGAMPPPPSAPATLPPGWQKVDGPTGAYYWNKDTGQVEWTPPGYVSPAAPPVPPALIPPPGGGRPRSKTAERNSEACRNAQAALGVPSFFGGMAAYPTPNGALPPPPSAAPRPVQYPPPPGGALPPPPGGGAPPPAQYPPPPGGALPPPPAAPGATSGTKPPGGGKPPDGPPDASKILSKHRLRALPFLGRNMGLIAATTHFFAGVVILLNYPYRAGIETLTQPYAGGRLQGTATIVVDQPFGVIMMIFSFAAGAPRNSAQFRANICAIL